LRRATILGFITSTTEIIGKKTRLRQKKIQDAVNEYHWRRDDELCRLDASSPITGTFQEYIHWYTEDKGYTSNSHILSIESLDGTHIGNFGCFNIDDVHKEVEIGVMIGEKSYWNHGYGVDVIQAIVDHLFASTHAQRIYLRTLDWNTRAHRCFLKCGFTDCGKVSKGDYKFLVMEITRPKKLNTSTRAI